MFFDIQRGVKQGDVLYAMFFNVAIETVFRRWKERICLEGFLFSAGVERLTNVRYADDVLLFGKIEKESNDGSSRGRVFESWIKTKCQQIENTYKRNVGLRVFGYRWRFGGNYWGFQNASLFGEISQWQFGRAW